MCFFNVIIYIVIAKFRLLCNKFCEYRQGNNIEVHRQILLHDNKCENNIRIN